MQVLQTCKHYSTPLKQVRTLIGYGSPNLADTHTVHGAALGKDETEATRKNLKWGYGPFEIPPEVRDALLCYRRSWYLYNICCSAASPSWRSLGDRPC